MLSKKGQESAPFELLIAIIVMTFVIVIGFRALDTLNEETCIGILNKNMEELKRGMESVVETKSKVTLSVRLPNCFNEDESELAIIDRREQVYCSNICGGSVAQCTILRFTGTTGSGTYSSTRCLNISSATDFPDAGTCGSPIIPLEPSDAFEVVEWKSDETVEYTSPQGVTTTHLVGIQQGDYTLIRQSNLFSQAPLVCVYKRV